MQILRYAEVAAKVGLNVTSIYRLEKAGQFPARIRLGSNSVGWVEEEVEAWLKLRRVQPVASSPPAPRPRGRPRKPVLPADAAGA
jgi:prophage regulatory protein